jgi:hypothetical protein
MSVAVNVSRAAAAGYAEGVSDNAMPFRAKTAEDEALYRCVKFCSRIARPLLEFLPKTREGQATLANYLGEKIAKSGEDFSISVGFLTGRMGCTDAQLTGNWTAAPSDWAWLMVHEQLSNYFCQFVIDNWQTEIFLIHHVPKSGGTSVCAAVYQQSYFVAYPHTSFEAMTGAAGLLGFARQLEEFEGSMRQDRIYIGGHYNLPDMLSRLGDGVQCGGVSLARAPTRSTSSAIRYIWTMVEKEDTHWTDVYPKLEREWLSTVRQGVNRSDDPKFLTEMRKIVEVILQTDEFRENYFDLFSAYYYNNKVNDVFALQKLFCSYPNVTPCVDVARDEDLICWQLHVDGPVPQVNASLFSHEDLARSFGGDNAFHAVIAAPLLRSAEIYGALCMMRASRPFEQQTALVGHGLG